jgi:hypothetical protein
MRLIPTTLLAALVLATTLAADNPASQLAAGPKNEAGLTATLIANKDTYTLDPTQSGKDFRDKLDAMKNARGRMGPGGNLPTPPAVDCTLQITNTSDHAITLTTGGDDSQITLKLEGPGAVTVDHNVPMTMEFRIGKPTTLAPGKSMEIKISSLAFGMRGISQYAYWTEPGDYTLTATLTYGTPEGKQGKVTSAATPLKVQAPKP